MTRPPLILASSSPRRKQMLEALAIPFELYPADVEETWPTGMPVTEVPEYLARLKAEAVYARVSSDRLVLAADTIVVLDGDIINKPGDEQEAIAMLERLSGHMHEVISGVCLKGAGANECFSSLTRVYFKPLKRSDIERYVAACLPLDKAGSYAIQEWIGMTGISHIEGDYFNVVGLPVNMVFDRLRTLGWV